MPPNSTPSNKVPVEISKLPIQRREVTRSGAGAATVGGAVLMADTWALTHQAAQHSDAAQAQRNPRNSERTENR
jgi:hypothetical protein